ELVMNALKHARPSNGSTTITMRLTRHGADQVRLAVTDNGAGDDPGESQGGLGTHLIRMLTRQLNGESSATRIDGRYVVTITFPLQAPVPWRPPS
ncbi:MAG: ATP-binding protein, partial [Steroidobacteraceae bacterium]